MGRDLLNVFMVTASYLGLKIVFKVLGIGTVSNFAGSKVIGSLRITALI